MRADTEKATRLRATRRSLLATSTEPQPRARVVEGTMLTSSNSRCGLRLGALVSLTILGCLPPSGPARPARPGTNLDEISRAEVDAGVWPGGTAYDLIRARRPRMLIARGVSTTLVARSGGTAPRMTRGIKVYVDGVPVGGVETLTSIPATAVQDVRWLSAVEATTRYGTGNANGAIIVRTRSR
jgi:hypothetical protein